jgi:diacylglycerol kinase
MDLKQRIDSFRYAFQGVRDLIATQPNTRIHLAAAVAVISAGAALGLSAGEWALISVCIALVISMEAMNTALEYLTDLVSPEYHPLAGKAKDAAAAAVLIAATGAAAAGLIIFLPKILRALVLFL